MQLKDCRVVLACIWVNLNFASDLQPDTNPQQQYRFHGDEQLGAVQC